MSRVKDTWLAWRRDPLLGKVIRGSSYLFSASTIAMGLTSLQGIVAILVLGPSEYGVLGMVIAFASNVNRLLSFRMGEVVVKHAGQYLAQDQKERAAAVIKAAGLAELLTSLVAYALLVALAPLAAVYIIKSSTATPMIVFYGLALVGNLVYETSTSVLQIGNHYRSQAAINLSQSVLTLSWISAAYLLGGGVQAVLNAYLAGKVFAGLGMAFAALFWLNKMLGPGWWKVSFDLIPNKRNLIRFAISTNLSGTINMLIRDSEVLWVGYFCTSLEAGYYKFALAVMNIVLMPVTALISTTFPEISKSVAVRHWAALRRLLRRTTILSAAYTLAWGAGIALVGPVGLALFKHGEYLPALPAVLILLLGYGMANIFFWNRPLLLAFSKPNYPLVVTAAVGLLKTVLMFILVAPFGYLAQAWLLSAYFVISVGLIVWRGLGQLKQAENLPEAEGT
jgi:O-antigen/teichoic acid export membrane protein